MSKLLFEESPEKNEAFLHLRKIDKRMVFIMACLFTLSMLAGIVGAYIELLAYGQLLVWIILSVVLLGLIAWIWVGWAIMCAQEKIGLRIYDDKICYKKVFQKEYTQIDLSPSQYMIRLRTAPYRSGYSIYLVFLNLEGKQLLTYKAVSLFPSPYQEPRQQWETDIFNIGCEIIDNGEVIKNK